jgi:hypothetical protein
MKISTPKNNKPQIQLQNDAAIKRMMALQEQGRYQEALDINLQIACIAPKSADAWGNAAVNCLQLTRWQDAIRYGQAALDRGCDRVELYDVLAHAYSMLGQWNEARRYGLQALNRRTCQFSGAPVIPPPEPGPLPPPPGAQTCDRNIIAFSLFGGDSKYCEAAVLNVQEQPHLYPYWVCRFYVDGSVPESVISRLRAGGAQIVRVEGTVLQWPGPMWRLLALDDPQAHRILFRDADSVISLREAHAVEQWLTSGKRFHMMRDHGSTTELILAGLWGVVAGSLPPLDKLMERFLSEPLVSRHFADQYFLRRYVWPYARISLMQHDSVFGFMGAAPFPDGEKCDGSFVGRNESMPFTAPSKLPDGTAVTWMLYRIIGKLADGQPREELICAYPGTVKDGVVKAHMPVRYAQWVQQGTACVRLGRGSPT